MVVATKMLNVPLLGLEHDHVPASQVSMAKILHASVWSQMAATATMEDVVTVSAKMYILPKKILTLIKCHALVNPVSNG